MTKLTIELDEKLRGIGSYQLDSEDPAMELIVHSIIVRVWEALEKMPSRNTSDPCSCGVLENFANDPELPIAFDKFTNEFHILRHGEDARSGHIIYRCFNCGGLPPASIRAELFHLVPIMETQRLATLCKDIRTLDDAIHILGKPDFDFVGGVKTMSAPKFDEAQVIEPFRALIYSNFSETASVHISDSPTGRARVYFQGKEINPAPSPA
jgi:hypothetical protein